MSRRRRDERDDGPVLVDAEDVPDALLPVSSSFQGEIALRTLLRDEDPEAFCQLVRDLELVEDYPDCALDDDEEEGQDDGGDDGTSIDDIAPGADANEFDRTFRITSDDVAFAPGDAPAIPRPWQGLPRVAITYNLNFVYDEDEDRWVRDTGNSAGGHANLFQTTTQTFPAGPVTTVDMDQAETSGAFEASDGDNAVTIPADGRYVIAVGLTCDGAGSAGTVNMLIEVNGSFVAEGGNTEGPGGNVSGTPAKVEELSAGDTVEFAVGNGSGSSVTSFGTEQTGYLSVGRL